MECINVAEFSFNIRFISKLMYYKQTNNLIVRGNDVINSMFTAIVDCNNRQGIRNIITECLCLIMSKRESLQIDLDSIVRKVCTLEEADQSKVVSVSKAVISFKLEMETVQLLIRQLVAILKGENSDATNEAILDISLMLLNRDTILPADQIRPLIAELCKKESYFLHNESSKRNFSCIVNTYYFLSKSTIIQKERNGDLEPRIFSKDLLSHEISALWSSLLEDDEHDTAEVIIARRVFHKPLLQNIHI